MFSETQKRDLSAKLEPDHIKKPGGKYGPKGDYIEGWHAIAEANRIFGFDGWSYAVVELSECHPPRENKGNNGTTMAVSYIARIRVTAGDVSREDVGFGSGFAAQLGDAYEGAVKEAVTDALKRALRTFGNVFGLALYDKSRANVGVNEPQDNSTASTPFGKEPKAPPQKATANGTYTTAGGFKRQPGERFQEAHDIQTAMETLIEGLKKQPHTDALKAWAGKQANLIGTLPDPAYDEFKSAYLDVHSELSAERVAS